MKKLIAVLFFMSVLAFSKDFWELSSFNVNVKETTSSRERCVQVETTSYPFRNVREPYKYRC